MNGYITLKLLLVMIFDVLFYETTVHTNKKDLSLAKGDHLCMWQTGILLSRKCCICKVKVNTLYLIKWVWLNGCLS